MPSSTSSFERAAPNLGWGRVAVLAAVGFLLCAGARETYLRRVEGFSGALANTDGLWAKTFRRVGAEQRETVIIGSSRVLFDFDLGVLAEELGSPHPIQLALEGTSPRPFLSALAQDESFDGFVIVGVTPGLFFSPRPGFRASALDYAKNQTPAQRIGQELAGPLERTFAFMDPDTALWTRAGRMNWPVREGMRPPMTEPHKMMVVGADRQADMFWRVERDPDYREASRDTWRGFAAIPSPPPTDEQLAEIVAATKSDVDAIRARGGEVVFVRTPSADFIREGERTKYPRERTWDRLLDETGCEGVHFEDHPELQGLELPEYSHLAVHEKPGFTRVVGEQLQPAYRTWRQGH